MTTKHVAREFDRAKLEEEVRKVLQERHEQTGMLVQGMLDAIRQSRPPIRDDPWSPQSVERQALPER